MRLPNAASAWVRRRPWLSVTALYAALVLYALLRELGSTAYDDSYFFKRFATHMLDHGVWAWNLADGPVHGSTSQLFQLIATGLAAITRTHFIVATKVFNGLCLVGAAFVILRWCGRATTQTQRGHAVALLALASPLVLNTAGTGMETASTLVLLAVVLTRLVPPVGAGVVSEPAAAGLTIAVYLCRPDAALIPAIVFVLDRLMRRQLPWRYGATLLVGMALTLALLWGYYGTPLPLSFYMKTAGLEGYGDRTLALGLQVKQHHFGATLAFGAPLLWIAVRRRDPTTVALLVSGVLLWCYHLLLTNEIMGYRGRFYLPAVVPLTLAAARSWDAFESRVGRFSTVCFLAVWWGTVAVAYVTAVIPTHAGFATSTLAWPAYLGTLVAGTWLLIVRASPSATVGGVVLAMIVGFIAWQPPVSPRLRSDDQLLALHARQVTTFRGVHDVARCLPRSATVYHSEMGVTGLVLPDATLVDLVGLLSRETVLDGRPFEAYCSEDAPEAIFLPHRNYAQLNAEIVASHCLRDYRRALGNSASPLFIRRDLFAPFMQCARDVHRYRKPRSKRSG